MYMNETVYIHVHELSCFFRCREVNLPSGCVPGRLHPVTGTRLELILSVLNFDSISLVFKASVL